MERKIRNILLFTVTACPMGRSMHAVVKEVCSQLRALEYEVVFADLQPDVTNRYRVTKNPTTLFLDDRADECYRVQGFMETAEMISLVHQAEAGIVSHSERPQEHFGSEEKYTIYLYRHGVITPVEGTYVNKTSVVTPRITAIKLLLQTREEGLYNPFPPSSELLEVDFADQAGTVKIRTSALDSPMDHEEMHLALLHTLSHCGIEHVILQVSAE